jgi:hypothetical protein
MVGREGGREGEQRERGAGAGRKREGGKGQEGEKGEGPRRKMTVKTSNSHHTNSILRQTADAACKGKNF